MLRAFSSLSCFFLGWRFCTHLLTHWSLLSHACVTVYIVLCTCTPGLSSACGKSQGRHPGVIIREAQPSIFTGTACKYAGLLRVTWTWECKLEFPAERHKEMNSGVFTFHPPKANTLLHFPYLFSCAAWVCRLLVWLQAENPFYTNNRSLPVCCVSLTRRIWLSHWIKRELVSLSLPFWSAAMLKVTH